MDVRTICLGLLSTEDRSGYEIKKLLEEGPLGHFVEASFGSIYPALTKMTEDGLVEFRTEEQSGRPDKKTYSITARGREVFRTALEGALSPDRFRSDFMFVLSFVDQMSPEHVTDLIEQRLAYYDQMISTIQAEIDQGVSQGPAFVGGHAVAIFTAARKFLKENRHLLEERQAAAQAALLTAAIAD